MPGDGLAPRPAVTDPPSPWRAILELVLAPFRLLGLLIDLVFLLLMMALLLGIMGFVIWVMWQLVF